MTEADDALKDTTVLLRSWTRGDEQAGEQLFDLLYDDMRAVASRRLQAESPSTMLSTTVLVHEAFLRVVDQKRVGWQGRAQFFAIAARVMRRILVDHARARRAEKRGGGAEKVSLEDLGPVMTFGERPRELLALDACLQELERVDPPKAHLVELRFFAGLSLEDTAETLGTSRASVVRQWRMTKGWLHRQMGSSERTPGAAPPG